MKTEKHLKYDVVCVGGGSAGVFAAVSAAQEGAKVVLLERSGFLGGTAALGETLRGLPSHLTKIQKRFLEILQELNGVKQISGEKAYAVNGEVLKLALQRLCRENGVEVFLFSEGYDVKIHDATVMGLSVVGKNVKFEIATSVLIDATGTGDVVRGAGLSVRSCSKNARGTVILTGICWDQLLGIAEGDACKNGYECEIKGAEYGENVSGGKMVYQFSTCLEPERYLVQFPVGNVVNPMDGEARSNAIMSAHIQALHFLDELKSRKGFENVRVSQMPVQSKIYGSYEVAGLEQTEQFDSEASLAELHKTDGSVCYIRREHLLPTDIEGLVVCGNLTLQGMPDRSEYSRGISVITGEAAGFCAGEAVKNACGIKAVPVENKK